MKTLLVLILPLFVVISCSKLNLANPPITLGTITANVNGKTINSMYGLGSVVVINGVIDSFALNIESDFFDFKLYTGNSYPINIHNYFEVNKKYTIRQGNYTPDFNHVYLPRNNDTTITVIFTAITDSTLKGTFSGLLTPAYSAYAISSVQTITNGQFYVQYKN
jgi:hypothetical protein